jgi:hypothetical protein
VYLYMHSEAYQGVFVSALKSSLRLPKQPTQPRAELVGLHRVKHRHSHAGCIQKSADGRHGGALVRGDVQELKCEPDLIAFCTLA